MDTDDVAQTSSTRLIGRLSISINLALVSLLLNSSKQHDNVVGITQGSSQHCEYLYPSRCPTDPLSSASPPSSSRRADAAHSEVRSSSGIIRPRSSLPRRRRPWSRPLPREARVPLCAAHPALEAARVGRREHHPHHGQPWLVARTSEVLRSRAEL